jgi:hypothetical protein
MSKKHSDLSDLIKRQLITLDASFAEQGIPIPERTIRAFRFISKHCISFDGKESQNPITSAWLGAVYYPVMDWYVGQYGLKAVAPPTSGSDLQGLALYRGILLSLRIPVFVVREGLTDDTFRLQLPQEADPNEDVLPMIGEPKPSMRSLRGVARQQLVDQIRNTAALHRKIWGLVAGAASATKPVEALKSALLEHLKVVARAFFPLVASSGSKALFEVRFCCELALKLHVGQIHGDFPWDHSFVTLEKRASTEVKTIIDRLPLLLKDYGTVNAVRYGSTLEVSTQEFFATYVAALNWLVDVLSTLKRDGHLGGMILTMRRPEWERLGREAYLPAKG